MADFPKLDVAGSNPVSRSKQTLQLVQVRRSCPRPPDGVRQHRFSVATASDGNDSGRDAGMTFHALTQQLAGSRKAALGGRFADA